MVPEQADIGIFGGTGFYSFLEDVEEVELETPYGKPSAPLVIGEIGGRRVAPSFPDTGKITRHAPSMTGAIPLYRSPGFPEVEPCRFNPATGATSWSSPPWAIDQRARRTRAEPDQSVEPSRFTIWSR